MNKKLKLIWQIYPSYLIVVIVSLLAVSLYLSRFTENFLLDKIKEDLIIRATLLENQIIPFLTPLDSKNLDRLCKKAGKSSETRVTVILPKGNVAGDSEEDPKIMDNHLNRPEILTALGGDTGSSIRKSETLKIRMMYVAIPLCLKNSTLALLRVSLPITSINQTIDKIQARIMMVGFFVALFAAVLSFFVSKWISNPIEEMKKGAARFATGDLGYRLHEPFILEFAGLAELMNKMALELEGRIATVKNQKNEYEAVLSSMSEGVVAIDSDEIVLNINQSAIEILKVPRAKVKGDSIQEVIRDTDFNKFIKKAAQSDSSKEGDFIIYNLGNRIVNCLSASLCNASDERIGTLLVLNDVSKIRNLENIRKDFVANVSHEIRTPLTAIKGFVETLFDMDDESTEDKKKFLKIILKHVDRLYFILEDLLTLAKIENRDEENGIFPEEINLKILIETALQIVQAKAAAKKITVELFVDERVIVKIDKYLIEQALVNLLDNAVKYSKEKTVIQVTALIQGDELLISVQDHGTGIPKNHLPRIFERFYRVDKARSRSLGGTGLGLSIVKHIATAHNGYVTVESDLNHGSKFTIHLLKRLIVTS